MALIGRVTNDHAHRKQWCKGSQSVEGPAVNPRDRIIAQNPKKRVGIMIWIIMNCKPQDNAAIIDITDTIIDINNERGNKIVDADLIWKATTHYFYRDPVQIDNDQHWPKCAVRAN